MPIWTPETTPPQISLEARDTVRLRIVEEGVVPVFGKALDRFGTAEPELLDQADILAFELHDKYGLGIPQQIMRIGASIAWLAYHETGYEQQTNELSQELSSILAQVEGVPEAYMVSLWNDERLASLITSLHGAPDITPTDDHAFDQFLGVGAGFVRANLQAALQAA